MVKINYDKLIINFDSWQDVQNLDNLTDEMNDNGFDLWRRCNWNEYLKEHYDFDISVTYQWGHILQFSNIITFNHFISKFIKNNISPYLKIDYEYGVIIVPFLCDVPNLDKLTKEMNSNSFKWWETNWNEYLSKHYGIIGDVTHSEGYLLRFTSVEKMYVFIINFL